MVGRPREDKSERIRLIAIKVAEGAFQPTIADELGVHLSTVQRAMRDMRAELAAVEGHPDWVDATKASAVQVARAWLARHDTA